MSFVGAKSKLGYGSFSIPAFLLALLLSFRFKGGEEALGDKLLHSLELPAWSNGTSGLHYTILLTIIISVLGWIIAKKFPNDLGAALGRRAGISLAIILTAMFIGASLGLSISNI